ncbi:MAG: enoyl-CoA hydratase-related protein [Candidatus Binatia bacterium]|nr:enoyl-CoA hydratase-related protein [Candidatus Binatia bacterium]
MIRREKIDRVLVVTIDRPEKKNALTLAMRQELERLPEVVNADEEIAVVVLTATEPVFSAGADLKEISERQGQMPLTSPGGGLRRLSKPTIAAVNGACVTGGLELALSCDFILASDRARFADTHAKLGVLPRWGMSALLPRRVGLAIAKELTLSGRWVDADEAARIRLCNRVVPHDQLRAVTLDLARQIAGNPEPAVRGSLDLLNRGAALALDDALALENEVGESFQVDPALFVRPSRRRS